MRLSTYEEKKRKRKRKRKRGYMTINKDLKKAYDRSRYDFIRDMLEDAGLPY